MDLFLDQLANGVSNGVIYAAVALSLVIIYRTTGLLNFAQGEMALFSACITWWLTERGLGVWFALLISVALAFVGGALLERLLIRPVMRTKNPLNVVIVTLGLFLGVNALAALIFIKPGAEAPIMPELFPDEIVLGPLHADGPMLGLGLLLAATCLVLWALLQKTKLGLALRGVASNADSAALVGIKPGQMLMIGWGLSAALGAIAGTAAASTASNGAFDTSLMQQVLVYAFAAAALGGFDSLLGAVVGGLVVGIANSLTVQYVHALEGIELVLPFGLILAVLLVRPNGLFGRNIVERV
ncbi:MAG: branched-chain amino acid ABC transporter permease [Acidimicrobiales bacterium]|nr:branched-chain amino acid ABC transporter permease [Acidimicrobiales bacterium]